MDELVESLLLLEVVELHVKGLCTPEVVLKRVLEREGHVLDVEVVNQVLLIRLSQSGDKFAQDD